jgi:hypothetical protein
LRVSEMSTVLRSRASAGSIKRKVSSAPWRGGLTGWRDQHGCSCAPGSRGSWPGADYLAGKCALTSWGLSRVVNLPTDRGTPATLGRRVFDERRKLTSRYGFLLAAVKPRGAETPPVENNLSGAVHRS